MPNRIASMMPSGNAGLITRISTVITPISAPKISLPVLVIAADTGSVAMNTRPNARPPTVRCQYQGIANIGLLSLPTPLNTALIATMPSSTPSMMRQEAILRQVAEANLRAEVKRSRKRRLSREKRMAFLGVLPKTKSGLKKIDLVKNKRGKIVSKRRSALGKENKWIEATQYARNFLAIEGFTLMKKDSRLYQYTEIFNW